LFFVPQLAATIIWRPIYPPILCERCFLLASVRARAPSKQETITLKAPKESIHDSLEAFRVMARAVSEVYSATVYPHIVS